MKITFRIDYRTQWGESLYIYGDKPALGNGDRANAKAMRLKDASTWELTVDFPDTTEVVSYRYEVRRQDSSSRDEYGKDHTISLKGLTGNSLVIDSWQDMPHDKPYYSSAFIDGILNRSFRDMPLTPAKGTLNIRVEAPMVNPDEVLAISGECPALGNWDPKQAILMNDAAYPVWEVNINLSSLPSSSFEYKFVVLEKKSRELRGWELGDNRRFTTGVQPSFERICLAGLRFANPNNHWRGAGTAIPVFSIRSEEDFGAGDFMDLKMMADWCVETGQKVLQLLPINDTTKTGTWTDSYPYSANSTFALHPMYMRLEAAGKLKDPKRREYYASLKKELNSLDKVDYERVNNAKTAYLRELYAEQIPSLRKERSYLRFVEKNEHWLRPYAAWCVLRDLNHTADNTRWGKYAQYEDGVDREVCEANKKEAEFYYFVQYHLDSQLCEARDYARQRGIILKGDIPIGIGRESVDAWQNTRLFNMDSQAGAPPDDFSANGQNWGFPTYNWDEMSRDGFAWWKARFRKMAEYFDAYRIDHILGFFRIWQIPIDAVHGLLGVFNPALPFSPDEMRDSYGFYINPDVQAHPLIREWMLTDFFHDLTDEAKERFLEPTGEGCYRLLSFVDTQRKVEAYFAGREDDDTNSRLRDGLYGLIDDVLFIEDPYRKGHYHPRIAAQFTYQYRMLNDYEKRCFDSLYNDFYYRRNNDFWYGKAMWKLPPIIDATGMLTCAEDLGMIPACVPEVMNRLQILALEIQRMPKDPDVEFGDTWSYPYYSVCTTSTHDMPGIRAWWESDPQMAQRYFNEVLREPGAAPYFAEPWICARIIDLHLDSPSMFCILPLQDWLSTDGSLRRQMPSEEQINEPANPRHYWRYRMHLTVEKLMESSSFNTSLRGAIERSGR